MNKNNKKILSLPYNNATIKFEILNFLGEGSQSKVYKCKNTENHILYAIKEYSKELVHSNDLIKSLLINEEGIHRDLVHKNVLQLKYSIKNENCYYLIFEYCNGNYLNKEKYKKDKIKNILYQIGEGLMYLKQNNILHLDIKLENILMKNNIPKISDFGFSVKIRKPTKISFRGTLQYISPEMILGEIIDYGSDLWSYGVCIFYINYGYFPFSKVMNSNGEYVNTNNENDIIENILNYRYYINPNYANGLCYNLICKIFVPINIRITIEDLLKDQYFKNFKKN